MFFIINIFFEQTGNKKYNNNTDCTIIHEGYRMNCLLNGAKWVPNNAIAQS